jgi:hypothetical protein
LLFVPTTKHDEVAARFSYRFVVGTKSDKKKEDKEDNKQQIKGKIIHNQQNKLSWKKEREVKNNKEGKKDQK